MATHNTLNVHMHTFHFSRDKTFSQTVPYWPPNWSSSNHSHKNNFYHCSLSTVHQLIIQ